MDAIYRRIRDETEAVPAKKGESEIRKFYAGKTVLITGATGTLGKLLIEKLLRECPDVKKVFVLCKVEKDSILKERREKFFQNVIFDKLRSQNANFDKNLLTIEGDLTKTNIGLSNADRSAILEETQLIFHNASTEQTDNDVSDILKVNVWGTKNILDLAKDCKKLEGFVYVSSTLAHAPEKDIKEEFYSPAGDLKMVADMLKAQEETANGLSKDAIATAIGDWPDLNAFSRSTAEDLVRDCARRSKFVCSVFRPSMMISTYKEPISGWSEAVDGPAYICLGASIGCIHTTYAQDVPMDCVPVDMCVNALLASTWDLIVREKKGQEAVVYNYGSSNVKPITLNRFYELAMADSKSNPPSKRVCRVFNVRTSNICLFHVLHVIFHLIPAFIACALKCLQGGMCCKKCCKCNKKKEPPMLCRLIRQFRSVTYRCNGGWKIHVKRMQGVWDKMNNSDKQLFFCDIRDLDWKDYLDTYWSGLKRFLLNEPATNVQKAERNMK